MHLQVQWLVFHLKCLVDPTRTSVAVYHLHIIQLALPDFEINGVCLQASGWVGQLLPTGQKLEEQSMIALWAARHID